MENFNSLPPTPMSPSAEKDWILWTHLSQLSVLVGIPGFIGPLVIWLLRKDRSERIASAAKESLNFQITMLIAAIVSVFLALVLIGFVGLIAVLILSLVFPIIGAVKASEGVPYVYPLTIRLIK